MSPSRAFISYAHADLKLADMVKNVLTSHGLSVWMDRDRLVGGNRWRDELREAIEQCDVFLIIMTPRALASAEVKKEYEAALSQGKRVIPLVWKRIRRAPQALQPLHWHDCSRRRGMRGLLDLLYTLYTQGLVAPSTSAAFDADMALARAIRGDIPPSWVVRRVDPLRYRRPYVLLGITSILALAAIIWMALIVAAAPIHYAEQIFTLLGLALIFVWVESYCWLGRAYYSRLLSGAFVPELVILGDDGFVVHEVPFWGTVETRVRGYSFAGLERLMTRRTWRGQTRLRVWGLNPPKQRELEIPRKFGEMSLFGAQVVAAFTRYKRGAAQPATVRAQAHASQQSGSME